uniref:Uncharacterized protein n=1 Tax=Chelydra serpentina TaxID=8475 RepID=A0A8C3SQQ7_CHESE
MATSASSYPWLADSWPAPNLLRSGTAKEPGCTELRDPTERYYNEAGISSYLAQTEKFGAGASDGPIYSTIDPASDEMRTFNGPQPGPSSGQNSCLVPVSLVAKMGKAKSMGKPVKTPSLNWTELLPPPPPASELSQYAEEEEEEEEEDAEAEEWCPPLPERTYLTETVQEGPCPPPPPRGDVPSPAHSYGQQSTATLTPSPRDETRAAEDIPRLHHFEIPHLPRAPSPPLTQSDPNLNALAEGADGHTPRHGHRRNLSQTPAHSAENVSSPSPGERSPGGPCARPEELTPPLPARPGAAAGAGGDRWLRQQRAFRAELGGQRARHWGHGPSARPAAPGGGRSGAHAAFADR